VPRSLSGFFYRSGFLEVSGGILDNLSLIHHFKNKSVL
jgi:hypothetical protein